MPEYASNIEERTITIDNLLERSAKSCLEFQQDDGSFPSGQNYDKNDQETSVRSTSHWLILLSHVYDSTNEEKYEEPIHCAVDYLLSNHVRPYQYTFRCRITDNKDKCNGIVGQGAPIRALAMAGEVCNREDAISTAKNVFNCISFDSSLGLWKAIEIDGKNHSFDRTLNHQILFAANLCWLSKYSEKARQQLLTFLSHITENMNLRKNGIIRHYVNPHGGLFYLGITNKSLLRNKLLETIYLFSKVRKSIEKRYHLVNLYALGVLAEWFPNNQVWESEKISNAVSFILNKEIQQQILTGDTEIGYTIPGIRAAWAIRGLSENSLQDIRRFIEADIRNKFDTNRWILTSDKVSQEDQAPMISHLVGLPNLQISLRSKEDSIQ